MRIRDPVSLWPGSGMEKFRSEICYFSSRIRNTEAGVIYSVVAGFSFGSTATSPSSSGGFTFGSSAAGKPADSAPPSGFIFGQSSKPAFGVGTTPVSGFGSGGSSPAPAAPTSVSAAVPVAPFAFGTSSAAVSTGAAPAPPLAAFSFGGGGGGGSSTVSASPQAAPKPATFSFAMSPAGGKPADKPVLGAFG
jgi:hypothetical protein